MNKKICNVIEHIETGDVYTMHSIAKKFGCTLGTAFDVIMYLIRNGLAEKNEREEYVVIADEKSIVKSACDLGAKIIFYPPEKIVELATKLKQEDCALLYKLISKSNGKIVTVHSYANFTPTDRMRMHEISADYGLIYYNKDNRTFEVNYRKSFVESLSFAINEWNAKRRERERAKLDDVYEFLADMNRIRLPIEITSAGVKEPKTVTIYNWIKMDENAKDMVIRVLSEKKNFDALFGGADLPKLFSIDMIDFSKSKFYYMLNPEEKHKFNVPDVFTLALRAHEKEIVELVNKGRAPMISCKLYLNRKYA